MAPSILAASESSAGTALIAADSTTVAKPAWIQIITTIIIRVSFQPPVVGKFNGPSPTHFSTTLTRPEGEACDGCWYIRLQMTAAPTNEIAVGRNTNALANASPRILSIA